MKNYSIPRSISVGIIDGVERISAYLKGEYVLNGEIHASGPILLESAQKAIRVYIGKHVFTSNTEILLTGGKNSTFSIYDITVGKDFHWQKKEEQVFPGNLIIKLRGDGLLCAVNEIDIEEYLKSVISSEMNAFSPVEFLKAQAIASRSWLLAKISDKGKGGSSDAQVEKGEILRIYGTEEHNLFDICADDHCQRYHGLTKIISTAAQFAVEETRGLVLMYGKSVCDARYSKCCGGITEEYRTAWEEKDVPYLVSVPDSTRNYGPLMNERDVEKWVRSKPQAFCNIAEKEILSKILSDTDLKTEKFFRWKVVLQNDELGDLIRKKTGFDIGEIVKVKPVARGPSGRIKKLMIEGSKDRLIVGKELEIRRILSDSHLMSSAFSVREEFDKNGHIKSITLMGAGWGHGVGMCQIGAAKMALMGYNFKDILKHYFRGASIVNIYEKEI